MDHIDYNFDDTEDSADNIPPPTGFGSGGPSEHDQKFLAFVTRTLRENGGGGMGFKNKKDRTRAAYRITRWIKQQHDINLQLYQRTRDNKQWLYWKLVDDVNKSEQNNDDNMN